MTHIEPRALDTRHHRSVAMPMTGFDGRTHAGEVAMALVPATLILAAATALLLALL